MARPADQCHQLFGFWCLRFLHPMYIGSRTLDQDCPKSLIRDESANANEVRFATAAVLFGGKI